MFTRLVIDGKGLPIHINDFKINLIDFCKYFLVNYFFYRSKFCNLTIDSDMPVNVAGRIVAQTDKYIDVQLNPSVPLEGEELFISSMTFTEDMVPTCGSFVSARPDPTRFTVIADILYRRF